MAVNLKITGDGAQFENELTKLQAQVARLEQQLKNVATTGKRGTKETAAGSSTGIGSPGRP